MKKYTLPIALSAMLLSNPAYSNPYLGLEFQNNKLSYNDSVISNINIKAKDYYESDFKNFAAYVGYSFDSNFALELSLSQLSDSKENNNTGLFTNPSLTPITTKTDTTLTNLTLDSIFSYPITHKTSVLGIAGVSLIQGEFNENYNVFDPVEDKIIGYALGLGTGIKYNITNDFAVRAKIKYSKVEGLDSSKLNGHDGVDNIFTSSLGFQIEY